MEYFVFDTIEEASKKAYAIMKANINEHSTLGLATGSSPVALYKEMIADHKAGNFSYKDITTFNLDEYVNIDKNHPESYYSFMHNNLFNHIDINEERIHIPAPYTNDDAKLAKIVKGYNDELEAASVDVQILGVGSNGHIAFNEPGTAFDSTVHIVNLKENTIKDNSRFFDFDMEKVPKRAMTMGIKNILQAKNIIFLAFGANKRDAVAKLLAGKEDVNYPCTSLINHPHVYVIVDKAADPTTK